MLLGYYLKALRELELQDVSYLNWLVAFVAVQMGAFFNRGKESELGLPWRVEWWTLAHHSSTCSRLEISCIASRMYRNTRCN